MSTENKKIVEFSTEAISFAKRMIALKWTKETNANIVAGNWQAGYVHGQIDCAGEKDKEIERLRDALDKIQSFHPDGNPIGMINYARAVLNNKETNNIL